MCDMTYVWHVDPYAFPTFLTEEKPTLEQLQEAVGGLIQIVPLQDGRYMVVNEEGLILDLPYNKAASRVAGFPIVGDAVIVPAHMMLD